MKRLRTLHLLFALVVMSGLFFNITPTTHGFSAKTLKALPILLDVVHKPQWRIGYNFTVDCPAAFRKKEADRMEQKLRMLSRMRFTGQAAKSGLLTYIPANRKPFSPTTSRECLILHGRLLATESPLFGLDRQKSGSPYSSLTVTEATSGGLSPSWRMTPLGHPLGMNSFTQKVSSEAIHKLSKLI